jgi:hypothetical protein
MLLLESQSQLDEIHIEYSIKQSQVYEDLDQTEDVKFETFELKYPRVNSTF